MKEGGREEGRERGGSEKWKRGGRREKEEREGLGKDLRFEWSPVKSQSDWSEEGKVGRERVIKAWT